VCSRELQRLLEQRALISSSNSRIPPAGRPRQALLSRASRRATITADFSMSLSDLEAQRHPAKLPPENFQPGRSSRSSSVTRMPAAAARAESLRTRQNRLRQLSRLIGTINTRYGAVRRQHEAAVVAVRHDDADEARGHPRIYPRRTAPTCARLKLVRTLRNSGPGCAIYRLQRAAAAISA
jgi:hypothetical protein